MWGIPVALLIIYFSLQPILESTVKKQLDAAGWDYEALVVGVPGLDGIGATGLARLEFPEDSGLEWVSIDRLFFGVEYNLLDLLLARRVETLHVEELEVSLDFAKWKPAEGKGEPLPDIREIPKIFLGSLPKDWPLSKLTTDKLLVHIKKEGNALHTIPLQLSFQDDGNIHIQAPRFQFDSNLQPGKGNARAKAHYSLEKIPGFLGILFPGFAEVEAEGLVFNSGLSVLGEEFGESALDIQLKSLATPKGTFQSPHLSFQVGPGLQPRSMTFGTQFQELEDEFFSATSGEIKLGYSPDSGLQLEASAEGGLAQNLPYQKLEAEAGISSGKMDASVFIDTMGKRIPVQAKLSHPYMEELERWFATPGPSIPEPGDPTAVLDALEVKIGPVEKNPVLNTLPIGIPASKLSGTFTVSPLQGGQGGRIIVEDGEVILEDTGLVVSGIQTDVQLLAGELPRTSGKPVLEIAGIHFGKLLLENGKIPFQLLAIGEGGDAKNVLVTQDIKFDSLGGKLGLGGTTVTLDGYDTLALAKVLLEDIELSQALALVDDFPVQLAGKFKGGAINFQYKGQQLELVNGNLGLNSPSGPGGGNGASFSYDAKGQFTKGLEPGTPAHVNMGRLEKALLDLDITQFNLALAPLGQPGMVLRMDITAKHESKGETLGLDLGIKLFGEDAEGGAALAVDGSLILGRESIPWKARIQNPYFEELAKWFQSPAEQLPEMEEPQQLVDSLALEIGPVELATSSLANWLVPGLPTTDLTGTLSLSRKPGEDAAHLEVAFQEFSIPENKLTLSGIQTRAAIGWKPTPHIVGEALVTIQAIRSNDIELEGTSVTAKLSPGEEILHLELHTPKLTVEEQGVSISQIRTNAAVGWNPVPHTIGDALLAIDRIEVKNWELENAKLPWQLLKEGVLKTPGGEVATLGGFIKLGATSVVLNGPDTLTTGLFQLKDIHFEEILALSETPPLFLKAEFDGMVPFVFQGTKLVPMPGTLHLKDMTNALLKYDAKGQLTQNQEPGTLGWKNMDMAEKALQDLQIHALTLKLYPDNDRDLPIQAMVKGSHDNGKRKINLELTLNLRGDVKAILEQAAKGQLEFSP